MLKTNQKRNLNEILLLCSCMRKSLSRTCQSLLHTCVSLPDAHSKKKGFLFCARSYLIEALQAQALTLCHMSWTGSFLGLFINRQAGAVHLG